MACKALLLAVSVVAIAAIVLATASFRRHWEIFLACGLMVIGNAAFPQWYLQGIERLRDSALIQAVTKVALALATVAMVRSANDVGIAAILLSVPQLVCVAVGFAMRKPLVPPGRYKPSAADIRASLGGSVHMFASNISTTLYGNTNTLILGLVCGERAVALYNLSQRLVQALQSIATPITQTVFPRASFLFAADRAKAWRLMSRTVRIILPAVGSAALVLAFFATDIAQILGGPSFADAAPLIRIAAITPVLISAFGLPAQIIMVSSGLTRQLLKDLHAGRKSESRHAAAAGNALRGNGRGGLPDHLRDARRDPDGHGGSGPLSRRQQDPWMTRTLAIRPALPSCWSTGTRGNIPSNVWTRSLPRNIPTCMFS